MLNSQVKAAILERLQPLVMRDGHLRYRDAECEQLESHLRALVPSEKCLLCSSGTAALEIGLRACGIDSDSQVMISCYDYPGNFWAIERSGARPLLVDVEADGWRIDIGRMREALNQRKTSEMPRALVVSHLHGQLQAMTALKEICQRFGIVLVEDCCQAIGATVDGRRAGEWGDLAVFSFGGGKLVSSGRGGALLVNSKSVAQRAVIAAGAGSGPYELSEIQAAVASVQLEWLPKILETQRQFFASMQGDLDRISEHCLWKLYCPQPAMPGESSIYQYGWLLRDQEEGFGAAEDRLQQLMVSPTATSLSLGRGFDGFHRRSQRRCDRLMTLENGPLIASQTVLMHHRVQWSGHSPEGVAVELVKALDSLLS